MRGALRLALRALVAIAFVALVPVAVPAALLLVAAETASGRLAGAAVFAALAWLIALARRSKRAGIAVGVVLVGLLTLVVSRAPTGVALPGSRVTSVFPGPLSFPRYSPFNLVPEIDQIKVGTYLIPAFDSIIDTRAASRIRDVTMAIYRPMEDDAEFRALGSVMAYAYEDRDSGHLYAYAPERTSPGERLPVLVYLHGSAGNFKAYFYLLKRLADARRFIVVCPSFGFGNWNAPGGVDAIEGARKYALATLGGDESRVVLMGLSNGGRGVTRAASSRPDHYAGLVLLSAVIERAVVGQDAFVDGWRGRPILALHGDRDDRIPIEQVRTMIALMRDGGALVDVDITAGEDHFLFFSRADDVLRTIGAWAAERRR